MTRKLGLIYCIVFCLILLTTPLLTSCTPQQTPTPSPAAPPTVVKPKNVGMGAFVDMTGPVRSMSYPGHVGFVTYWRWLNETKGGIDGVPINIIEIDTAYDIKKMRAGYDQYKSQFVTCEAQGQSPFFDSLLKNFSEDKMPAFAAIGGSDAFLYPPTGWVFGGANTSDYFACYADFALKNWKESRKPRVALLLGDYPGGRFPLFCPPYLESRGMEVVSTELLPYRGMTSAMDQLLRMTQAKPDFVFTTIIVPQLVIVLDELKGMGIKLGPKSEGKDFELIYSYGFDKDMMATMRPENWDNIVVFNGSYDFRYYGKKGYEFYTLMTDKYMEYFNVPKDRLAPSIAGFYAGAIMAEAVRLAAQKVGWDKLNSEAVGLYGYPNIKDFETGLCPKVTLSKEDPRTHIGIMFRLFKDGTSQSLGEFSDIPWVFKWLDQHGKPYHQ